MNTLETEQKVSAAPFFANITTPQDPTLAYAWRVNGDAIAPNPREPQTLTITASGYRGAADIALELTSVSDMFLQATKQFELIFGGEDTSFFSSLNPFGSGE